METDLNFYQLLLNEPQIVYDITEKVLIYRQHAEEEENSAGYC